MYHRALSIHGLPKIAKTSVSAFSICLIPLLDLFKNRTAEAEPHLHLQLTLQKSLRWIKERWPWWRRWAGSRGGAICSSHLWRSSPSERGFVASCPWRLHTVTAQWIKWDFLHVGGKRLTTLFPNAVRLLCTLVELLRLCLSRGTLAKHDTP